MGVYSRGELESILDEYGDMVYRMAFIQVKNRDLADDIYQEVCIRLLKQRKKFQDGEHMKAWLLRTTVHCCRDLWKSAWRQKVVLGKIPFGEPDAGEASPSGQAGDGSGWVTQCVQQLPEKYRVIIHLYYCEEYSQKEIAQILKMNENTVASERIERNIRQEGAERIERNIRQERAEHIGKSISGRRLRRYLRFCALLREP